MATPLGYFKAGTIERLMKSRDLIVPTESETGEKSWVRLSLGAKALAASLIGRAQRTRQYVCFIAGGDAELADDLDIDAKTLRKHLQQLIDAKLVAVDRASPRGQKTYRCLALFEAFGEMRTDTHMGKDSRTKETLDGEIVPADGETFPSTSGKAPCGVGKTSLSHTPRSPRSSHSHLEARRRAQWGFNNVEGVEREAQFIVEHLQRWRADPDEWRPQIKRYGFVAAAGAVAYVLSQICRGQHVSNPCGLVKWALEKGCNEEIPA